MGYLSLFLSKSKFSPDTYTILTDGFVVQSVQITKNLAKKTKLTCVPGDESG